MFEFISEFVGVDFAYPNMFWILLILPIIIGWYFLYKIKHKNTLKISTIAPFYNVNKGIRYYLQHVPFLLRCLTLICFILIISRPRSTSQTENIKIDGIDIVIALDISSSMLAQDFSPNRLVASKEISTRFIAERMTDRIGLVVFAGESFTQCPLTTDKVTLINLMQKIETGMIDDGTAIGSGLATSVNRLKESTAISRVIILLTDGVNNMGEIAPVMAADLAANYGIRIYTVGVGTIGTAPAPVMDRFGRVSIQDVKVEIDEPVLKEIAKKTGGLYFRATSNTTLKEVYSEINQLEKSKLEHDYLTNYKEEYLFLGLLSLSFLLLEFVVRFIVLRKIP